MKKTFIIFLFSAFSAQAQPQWNYGLELNWNGVAFFSTYQRMFLNSCNTFLMYGQHEVYTGFDVSNLIGPKIHRVWGFESGYKFHQRLKGRKSNIVADLNYQFSKFCRGCTLPVSYNFVPGTYNDRCLASQRVRTSLLSLGLGYEMFYTRWLSTSLTVGPGINWGILSDPPFDTMKYFNRPPTEPSPFARFNLLVKASIRITL